MPSRYPWDINSFARTYSTTESPFTMFTFLGYWGPYALIHRRMIFIIYGYIKAFDMFPSSLPIAHSHFLNTCLSHSPRFSHIVLIVLVGSHLWLLERSLFLCHGPEVIFYLRMLLNVLNKIHEFRWNWTSAFRSHWLIWIRFRTVITICTSMSYCWKSRTLLVVIFVFLYCTQTLSLDRI